jgi:hypothetical protein
MGLDHPVADFIGLHRTVAFEPHLNQAALEFRHDKPLFFNVLPGFSCFQRIRFFGLKGQ